MSQNETYQTPHNDGKYMFQAVLRLSDLAWPWTTTYITEGGAAGATWLHLAPLRTGSAGITGGRESGRTGINGFGLKYFFFKHLNRNTKTF